MGQAEGRIVVSGLTKQFKKVRAVDDLSFTVEPGTVTGFLGPNGAGKTTTLRMLLGLVRPTAGTATIGGRRYADLEHPLQTVGAALEASSFHEGRTGRNHLRVMCAAAGLPRARADEVLEQVGMTAAANRKVRGYSLGMRQRLGLAAALLKDPEVLILDEPANGLDPAGIKEVRDLLRGLGDEGRTVFVSSHLLPEVRQTCDRVAILARGRCVAAGPVTDVLANGHGTGLLVRLEDLDRGRAVLAAAGIAASLDGDHLRVSLPPDQAATVTYALAGQGLYVTELRPDEADLETVFLELTAEQPLEVAR
jgi:ABC-2 type transport system ATP-binding protein